MNKDNEQREISRTPKFRVWNGTEMVYDVTVGRFGVFYVNPTNNGLDPNDSASITPFTTKYHEGTPVMQFTGLLDKNGKEIYEGDRLRLSSSSNQMQRKSLISEVGFLDGAFCAYWRETELWEGFNVAPNSVVFLNSITSDQIEVIGNIYSPEPIVK